MVEKSMLDPDEIAGSYQSFDVPSGEQSREAMHVGDNDTGVMPDLGGAGAVQSQRENQVDSTAIEYTQQGPYMGPRSLAQEAQHGGFSQPGDQSYPEEPHRQVAGTRGAMDIGKIAGYPAQGQDAEEDVV
jgi:hypothetical protein